MRALTSVARIEGEQNPGPASPFNLACREFTIGRAFGLTRWLTRATC